MMKRGLVKSNYKLQIMRISQDGNRTRHENDDHEHSISARTDKG
jgi:hypothetical protein